MRTRQESTSTLADMLYLLPVLNHNFTSFGTVEKRTRNLIISTFLLYAYNIHPSRAKNFCRVNGALTLCNLSEGSL